MKKEPEKAQKILEKIESSIKRKEKYNKVYASEKKERVEKQKGEKGIINEKLKENFEKIEKSKFSKKNFAQISFGNRNYAKFSRIEAKKDSKK